MEDRNYTIYFSEGKTLVQFILVMFLWMFENAFNKAVIGRETFEEVKNIADERINDFRNVGYSVFLCPGRRYGKKVPNTQYPEIRQGAQIGALQFVSEKLYARTACIHRSGCSFYTYSQNTG